jgi:hypothetical protein
MKMKIPVLWNNWIELSNDRHTFRNSQTSIKYENLFHGKGELKD